MGKIVLITGAYRGLGLETAKGLSAKGFHVVISSRKKEEGLKAVQIIQKSGGSASFLFIDVSNQASIKKAAEEFGKEFDHLDVLINNAAIFPDKKPGLLEASAENLLQAFTTNTLGAIWMIQSFYPHLKKNKGARIINISSGLGSLAEMEDYAPCYSISKTALNAVTRQFSLTLGREGIAVNSVCPGWCRTEMGGANATRSVEEGAAGIIWLAVDAPQNFTGKFVRDGKEIKW